MRGKTYSRDGALLLGMTFWAAMKSPTPEAAAILRTLRRGAVDMHEHGNAVRMVVIRDCEESVTRPNTLEILRWYWDNEAGDPDKLQAYADELERICDQLLVEYEL